MLEEGARKEGRMMLYTSLIVDQAARPLVDNFRAKYPYVDLEFIRSDTQQIVQRVFAEARAGAGQADVVVASSSAALKQAGLLEAFVSPSTADFPADYVPPDNLWAPVRFSYNGLAYNTSKVPEAEAPKTLDDLLDPKWKGRMVWGRSLETAGPLFIDYYIKAFGLEPAKEFFGKLAAQQVAVASGSVRSVLDQVIAGQYDLMISAALHHVIISHDKGAPVWFAAPDPVLSRPDHVQLLKSAPNPNSAMLFVDFLLSEEGQNVLKDAQYIPANPKAEPPEELRPIIPALNGKTEIVLTPEDSLNSQEVVMEIFNATSK